MDEPKENYVEHMTRVGREMEQDYRKRLHRDRHPDDLILETTIGPVVVSGWGAASEHLDRLMATELLKDLAKDDDFWLRLHDCGVNRVHLEV